MYTVEYGSCIARLISVDCRKFSVTTLCGKLVEAGQLGLREDDEPYCHVCAEKLRQLARGAKGGE